MFIKELQNNIKNFCKKEVVFSTKDKYLFSFRPALILQGFLVVFVFLFSSVFAINLLPSEKVDQSLVISNFETKNRAVVNQATEHIVLVKISDISQDSYYLKLPKSATNIKVTQISAGRASIALQGYGAPQQISDEDRRILASGGKKTLAGKIGIASLITKSAANLGEAITDIVENISGSDLESEAQVIETNDSVYVDLSQAQEDIQDPQIESDTPVEIEQVAQQIVVEQITDLSQTTTPSDSGIIASPSETSEEGKTTSTAQEQTAQEQTTSETVSPSNETPRNDENIEPEQQYIQVTYETPAPEITEEKTDAGKLVTVSAESEDPDDPITNVLASTSIPEIYKVGQENKIQIKWKNQGDREVEFHAYDLDGNGKLDYVEWTIPHLSEQIFEIIFISKAFRLDENREILEDIYEYVQAKDNSWVSLINGEYIRVTFEQELDNFNDITIYAKGSGTIEVYEENTDDLIAIFSAIDHEAEYKIFLTSLQTPTDVFDLKISGNIDFDYIVDPTITDSFADESKIGTGTTYVDISSGALIMPCYTPTPSWTKVADTLVRDIAGAYNSTIAKDIYCDDNNCILWTDGATAPGTVCIATDANVYGNVLWSKTNESGTYTWSDSNFDLIGEDIGGAHPTFSLGANNVAIGGKKWLERYYSNSASGMFNAMDACKTKGLGWRLPTIIELDEIRDQAKGSPYSYLPNIVANAYWSSSEYSTSNAYFLNFSLGYAYGNTKSISSFVRCVRGY
jgi:hypothetical protein